MAGRKATKQKVMVEYRIHHLKVCSTLWHPLEIGVKTWEFRKNDRDYKKGDNLTLRKWNTEKGEYSDAGEPWQLIYRHVTFVIYGPAFGIPEGYCIMSIK